MRHRTAEGRAAALLLLAITPLLFAPRRCKADQFPITREYSFEHWENLSDAGAIMPFSVEVSAFSFDADLSPVLPGNSLTVTSFVSCLHTCSSAMVSSAQGTGMTVLLNGGVQAQVNFSYSVDTYNFPSADAQFFAYITAPVTVNNYQPFGVGTDPELWQMKVSDLSATAPEPATWILLILPFVHLAFGAMRHRSAPPVQTVFILDTGRERKSRIGDYKPDTNQGGPDHHR